MNREWRFIINQDSEGVEMFQRIRIGKCLHTGSCRGYKGHHKSQCKQLYLEQRLISISNKQEIQEEKFPFPSCCSCHIMKNSKFPLYS